MWLAVRAAMDLEDLIGDEAVERVLCRGACVLLPDALAAALKQLGERFDRLRRPGNTNGYYILLGFQACV